MAASYAIYHGPEGLKNIAGRIHALARVAHREIASAGFKVSEGQFFDTFTVDVSSKGMNATQVQAGAASVGANVRIVDENTVGVAMGEGITREDLSNLLAGAFKISNANLSADDALTHINNSHARDGEILTHPIFNMHHSETQMLRYLKTLENRDLALNHSMISLGSCTMKLNATSEMIPITMPEFANIHPFAPHDQVKGYHELIEDLNTDLAEITGFAAVSAQPNSGATGEYAGLLAIKDYLESIGQGHRNVCLIPKSAHGTNPASAVMAGMKVVVIENDDNGNIDFDDLQSKIAKNKDSLAAFMVTYPSTFGVFEEKIVEICDAIHDAGGQVYMDGANMNAQVGLTSPGLIGADVCHLNLHKTFCIPHGGGGPGTSFPSLEQPFTLFDSFSPACCPSSQVLAPSVYESTLLPFFLAMLWIRKHRVSFVGRICACQRSLELLQELLSVLRQSFQSRGCTSRCLVPRDSSLPLAMQF